MAESFPSGAAPVRFTAAGNCLRKFPTRRGSSAVHSGRKLISTKIPAHGRAGKGGWLFDFLDNGKNHGAPFGAVVEIFAQGIADLGFDGIPFGHIAGFAAVQYGFDAVSGFGEEGFAVSYIDEAAGNDVRACQNLVASFFQGDDYDDYAVLGQLLAVADDDISYIPYAQPSTNTGLPVLCR